MDNKLVTVFTPTYNRADIIHRCYESLCNQTTFNFKWLIVDDGSSDVTRDIVKQWIKRDNKFEITYIYKKNGGLHTAYNTALEAADCELFVCFESDDIFAPDAMEKIEKIWGKIKEKGYVGFITLCKDMSGKLIGTKYPDDLECVYFWKHRRIAPGDKQYVFKTELIKKVFPMPVYEGEKFFDPVYSFYALDQYGPLGVTNESFDIVDYQKGGLTDTVMYHYCNSPNSFAEFRKMYMQLPESSFGYLIRQNIHYVSSCFLARHKLTTAIADSPRKAYTILSIVPGILFAIYIKVFYNKL
ncbi:MAG: glycosyltransferase family 2 protein [Clostridia bacterium]|nr:glycosyltransferase family 2 protein [Clostridia bacterium]